MFNRKCRKWRAGVRSCLYTLLIVSLGWCVTPAQAGLSEVTFEIQAVSDLGSGSFTVTLSQTIFDSGTQTWSWTLGSPTTIMDGSTPIATINAASFTYVNDPRVNLAFSVTAMEANTVFSISSGLLGFTSPVDPASGSASAGLLVTDTNGDGATLTGFGLTGPTGGAYLAQYNGSMVPGGTIFAELMTSPLVAGINLTTSTTGEFPPGGGFAAIGVPVSSMSAHFHFELSAFDLASGSSSFLIVPAPGALGLLAIGLIGSRRRRRPPQ